MELLVFSNEVATTKHIHCHRPTGFSAPYSAFRTRSKAITQYVHDIWITDNGLPQNSAYSIHQTRDGYLWFGTGEGLVRFDGLRFTVFDKKNTHILKSNWVFRLLESRDGSLWALKALKSSLVQD